MTAKQVIEKLRGQGWFLVRQKGSHKHYAHFIMLGIVTVPFHASKDIPAPTLANIYRQAGWRRGR